MRERRERYESEGREGVRRGMRDMRGRDEGESRGGWDEGRERR